MATAAGIKKWIEDWIIKIQAVAKAIVAGLTGLATAFAGFIPAPYDHYVQVALVILGTFAAWRVPWKPESLSRANRAVRRAREQAASREAARAGKRSTFVPPTDRPVAHRARRTPRKK